MKYITIQIPVPLASKLVDAIQVGAEGFQNVGAKLAHVTPRERHDAAEQN